MTLEELQNKMMTSAITLADIEDEVLDALGLTEGQIDQWHAAIEEAREQYMLAVLSIETILKK